jgi:hypothetical protein
MFTEQLILDDDLSVLPLLKKLAKNKGSIPLLHGIVSKCGDHSSNVGKIFLVLYIIVGSTHQKHLNPPNPISPKWSFI